MFAYLLNTASTLLAATGPASRRAEAVRSKLEVRWGRAGVRQGQGGAHENIGSGPLCCSKRCKQASAASKQAASSAGATPATAGGLLGGPAQCNCFPLPQEVEGAIGAAGVGPRLRRSIRQFYALAWEPPQGGHPSSRPSCHCSLPAAAAHGPTARRHRTLGTHWHAKPANPPSACPRRLQRVPAAAVWRAAARAAAPIGGAAAAAGAE